MKDTKSTALSYKKSNRFVTAKYDSSLLENQVMAIALTRIEERNVKGITQLEARLFPSDLRRLIDRDIHIYRDLKSLAKQIIGHTIFIEDGKGNFRAYAMIPNANYEDGVFTIEFNKELREHIVGLEAQGNYTKFELPVMLDFERNTTFRLYELLKKEVYRIDRDHLPYVEKIIRISELRFAIGIANADHKDVKDYISTHLSKSSDDTFWDKAYEALPKDQRMHSDWGDFKRRVLNPARDEMAKKAYLRFEYEPIKEGHGFKKIKFRIFINTPENIAAIEEKERLLKDGGTVFSQIEFDFDDMPVAEYEEVKDPILLFIEEYKGKEYKEADLRSFLKAAKNDIELVKKCIALYEEEAMHKFENGEEIKNTAGWIISCIKKGGYTKETVDTKEIKALKEFTQELERERPAIAKSLWEKIKANDDYAEFEEALAAAGYGTEILEVILSPEDLVKAYYNFKRNGDVNIE